MKKMHETDGETFVKALVYGKPGTGKTSFGVTAPKPLILLTERQGYVHIRQAAARLGVPVPETLFIEDAEDLRNVARAVFSAHKSGASEVIVHNELGQETYRGPAPKTLVIDSITDAFRLLEDEIKREAPPQKGKDGLDAVSERYWGALADRGEKLIRGFRNLPVNVLFLALEDEKQVGEGAEAERLVGPMLPMRKMPSVLAAAVNVVGITVRAIRAKAEGAKGDAKIVFAVRTVGPSCYLLKPCRPLRDTEVSDFSSWVDRMNDVSLLAPETGLEEEPTKQPTEMPETEETEKTELPKPKKPKTRTTQN